MLCPDYIVLPGPLGDSRVWKTYLPHMAEASARGPDITFKIGAAALQVDHEARSSDRAAVGHAQYTKQVCCEAPERTRLWRSGARSFLKSQIFGKRADPIPGAGAGGMTPPSSSACLLSP